ncbi:MAG: DUF222 domain-containing protein, partial [Propionibacteriaceae bacterium]|nr:DUF222 domain-containing protein [Propionibacteriaceae bacterium]
MTQPPPDARAADPTSRTGNVAGSTSATGYATDSTSAADKTLVPDVAPVLDGITGHGDHLTSPATGSGGPTTVTGSAGVVEPVQGWDRVRVIQSLRAAAAREREAEVDQYALVAAAADVYSWVDNAAEAADVYAGGTEQAWPPHVVHGERLWQFGSDGTPEVAEFITFEVGPALGVSPDAAAGLIADVLDLRHRLPRTWQLLLQGRVLGWVARKIAQTTRHLGLTAEITELLDQHIAPFLEGWTPRQTLARVAMLIAHLDPDGTEQRRRS